MALADFYYGRVVAKAARTSFRFADIKWTVAGEGTFLLCVSFLFRKISPSSLHHRYQPSILAAVEVQMAEPLSSIVRVRRIDALQAMIS